MRRIRLVVVLGVVMAAMLALSAGPAMADDLGLGDVDFLGDDLVLLDEDVFDDDLDSSFFFGGFVSDCPFAGDFEGIVNQFDCLDDGDDFGDVVLHDDGDFCDDDDLFDDEGDFCDDDDIGHVVLLVDDDDHFFDDGDRDCDCDRDHPRRHHRR